MRIVERESPVSFKTAESYIAHRHEQGVKKRTLKNQMASIKNTENRK
ncbi:phage integrase N-terminal domain-containing protein [Proteus mirabilis]|nr:hypothetical protein [Proteus mirabilis]HEK2042030.1 hypothetical protein [Proteus mirabilis]HEK2081363.1 hypothetical protein [Proteus mirabilis]